MHHIEFGMAGAGRAPLAELLDVLDREFALERQRTVEHGAHVSGVQVEAVAAGPCRVFRVIDKILTEEHVDEVSTTHGTTRVAGVSLLYHRGSQNTNVVGCMVHHLNVVHNDILFLFVF